MSTTMAGAQTHPAGNGWLSGFHCASATVLAQANWPYIALQQALVFEKQSQTLPPT